MRLFALLACLLFHACSLVHADESVTRLVGVAKVDVTPSDPLRLSGYSRRDLPFESVDSPLAARSLAFRDADGPIRVLVSVDTIGLPATVVDEIFGQVAQKHAIKRADFVLCSTHNHTAPKIAGGLSNLLLKPMTDEESEKTLKYTQWVKAQVADCIDASIASMKPGRLFFGEGKATFAINRRVIRDGKWAAFGETQDGPVDHRVSVIRAEDTNGKLLGVVFNYACHCTTLGPDFNQVCSEWAGDAARQIESGGEVVALCTIGCGADANPSPRGERAHALEHGRELASVVSNVIQGPMQELGAFQNSSFTRLALRFDLPTKDELKAQTESDDVPTRRHAHAMLKIFEERNRLPANHPMPIGTWQFGDGESASSLKMIFFGGEVVAEYALRLQQELAPVRTWSSAYSNDVFGYVASERMRSEGGYEVDYSMIYYLLPGRWATGTEDAIIERVHQMLSEPGNDEPVPADKAESTIRVPEGWKVQLAASEPLIADPIHLSFDKDGSLWVVEMGDYPLGENGGRIKHLFDDDGDGTYDRAVTFCDGLSYPTSAMPWGDGILVTAAPHLTYYRDTDTDGVSDQHDVLFEGFAEANPQHRANGFCLGLDGWLYLAGGDDTKLVRSVINGQETKVSHQDIAIDIKSGRVRGLSGFTQFGRYRNDWGDWFGGDNSHPLRHFSLPSHVQHRNSHVDAFLGVNDLTRPASAPPIFPATASSQRYNDLFAAGRFTSACSHSPVRDSNLRQAMLDGHSGSRSWDTDVVLICEPVHNLVHRAVIEWEENTLVANRHERDRASEWLAATDPWFRPVQAITGPDGAVWVVDMYRNVIEHPEWIPDQWQAQMNLRAGEERGRIWRIIPPSQQDAQNATDVSLPSPSVVLKAKASHGIPALSSSNGVLRDMAFSQMIQRHDTLSQEEVDSLRQMASEAESPTTRLTATACLARFQHLDVDGLIGVLRDRDSSVQVVGLRLIGSVDAHQDWLSSEQVLNAVVDGLLSSDPTVRKEASVAIGQFPVEFRGKKLVTQTLANQLVSASEWPQLRDVVLTSSSGIALQLLQEFVGSDAGVSLLMRDRQLLRPLMVTAVAEQSDETKQLVEKWASSKDRSDIRAAIIAAWAIAQSDWSQLAKREQGDELGVSADLMNVLDDCVAAAQDVKSPVAGQLTALELLASGYPDGNTDVERLASFIEPAYAPEVQRAAVDAVASIGEAGGRELIRRLPEQTPGLQSRCVDWVLQRNESIRHLLAEMESGSLDANVLVSHQRDRLLGYPDKSIRVRAERLLGSHNSDVAAVISSYRKAISDANANRSSLGDGSDKNNDIEQGRAVYRRVCAACHRLNGEGFEVGPDLATVAHRDNEFLLTAIFDPNSAIESRYRQVQILTLDGRVAVGIVLSQDEASVRLIAAEGKVTTINREDIESMKTMTVSLMPAGIERDLTPQAFYHLLSYLRQPL
ncbi:Neutral ceramidase precursor [Rubripirellula amarantea]|uniref:Neutral ceramidase n=1 Tax=Rubripirellula amarantea TaxID=2527999 RepID=A0A5C5WRK0_9BACT|nr:neutral/alkaline non-lysosomal ceramidase N-terminal domain-containing protein [Rubripirellula amarantea]TWT53157.1 Neutral ceramidase precursor [Rubripirellula amarantea]